MWAAIDTATTADGCPVLDGTYGNAAIAGHPAEAGLPPGLSEVFSRLGRAEGPLRQFMKWQGWPAVAAAESVQFRQTSEALVVTFVAGDGQRMELPFRRYRFNLFEERYDDFFTCYPSPEGSRLRFMAEVDGYIAGMPDVVFGGGATLVLLLKAADGSLIVQWRTESLFIPAFILGTHMRFDSLWWRYPPHDSAMLRK